MAPLLRHMSYWRLSSPFDKSIKAKGLQKPQFSNTLVNWQNLDVQSRLLKNPNFPSLLSIGKNLEVYTTQDQHFKIQILNLWMNWENLCRNLCFTVENNLWNSHKKRWLHFKLNIDDWDIPFPKTLRIYQWIGKNIFHWGKWNELIGNSAHTTECLAKRPWRYMFLAYLEK